ncbi:Hypothetical protein R9X50_00718800 [Acrodontium crateriforme]|uniref:HNH endonuclease n=1 Tax=Acrodontium crateriforme TaxID=150365 RepID=A0AAQ3MAE4_9PEZI|nr:Hypothetical protein R9X50_00718800 [Acrodontium crateriforme]
MGLRNDRRGSILAFLSLCLNSHFKQLDSFQTSILLKTFMIAQNEASSFELFRESLSTTVIERLAPRSTTVKKRGVKGRKNEIKPVVQSVQKQEEEQRNDAEELSEFIEYLAEEIFLSLPLELRTLSYAAVQDDAALSERYDLPLDSSLVEQLVEHLPPSTTESLDTYGLTGDATSLDRFLERIIIAYVTLATAAPPEYTPSIEASRACGCEICARDHLPLTYHHLIPRAVHAKAVKRGWHRDWELNKVAWLCRACHSFVHKIATNEELAKELCSIDLLLAREDVVRWAAWVGRVRWKAR